jgi:hypothetical protein
MAGEPADIELSNKVCTRPLQHPFASVGQPARIAQCF